VDPAPSVPTRPSPPAATAWPHAAQLAAAFLLGAAFALLSVRLLQGRGGRPLDISPGPTLDLNRAAAGELLQLPGVGPALATRIAETRDARGGFQSTDDLRSVPGVGPARMEKVRPWVKADGPEPSGVVTTSKKLDPLHESLDLNRATAEELQKLPGVGPKLAQRIVDERSHRPFTSVDDLRPRVSGIGVKTLEKIRPFVMVGSIE
jgi:competence ComEA-like helix-hairpin-helix protein